MAASVSGISGGSRRPAAGAGVRRVTSADGGSVLTGVVRCDPVVRGPDVAPPWGPSGLPVTPSLLFVLPGTCSRGAEVRRSGVSVADRGEPAASCSERHGDGTVGEDEPAQACGDGCSAQAMGEVRPRTTMRLVGCAHAPAECVRRELSYG
jgi:hypothetical protein